MKSFTITTTLALLALPLIVWGQEGSLTYQAMTILPGNTQIQGATLSTLLTTLYFFAIGIAALLAVFKIIIAGVKFMLTDAVPSRGSAKKDIEGALLGLILIIAAVLILNVINPTIVGPG